MADLSIFHTHDAVLVNRIANSDGVREYIRPDQAPVDLTAAVEPPSTQTGIVALTNGEDAVGLFTLTHLDTYQAHTLFARTCRGRRAIETARAMLAWLFRHGAVSVWGDTPRANRKACLFSRLVGARSLPTSDATHEVFEYRRAF